MIAETEEQKQERWNRYNLNIGETVYVKCKVESIGPNCIIGVSFQDNPDLLLRVHRNFIINDIAPAYNGEEALLQNGICSFDSSSGVSVDELNKCSEAVVSLVEESLRKASWPQVTSTNDKSII